jgi:hypothetical protein
MVSLKGPAMTRIHVTGPARRRSWDRVPPAQTGGTLALAHEPAGEPRHGPSAPYSRHRPAAGSPFAMMASQSVGQCGSCLFIELTGSHGILSFDLLCEIQPCRPQKIFQKISTAVHLSVGWLSKAVQSGSASEGQPTNRWNRGIRDFFRPPSPASARIERKSNHFQ